MTTIVNDITIVPCNFEWSNGWGTHFCFLPEGHDLAFHSCTCDAHIEVIVV
jgi:hypothetical protein